MDLSKKKCLPCEGGVGKLDQEKISQLLKEIQGWETFYDSTQKIRKNFKFKDFLEAISFVNKMAAIAEAENHHPDFEVHYNEVKVVIWTHAIGGLSENDFILAAKIDQIV